MRITVALVASVIATGSRADIVAGPFVSPTTGHDIYLLSPQNWLQAEAEAQSLGGHLATVRSLDECSWLANTFVLGNLPSRNRPVWIGFTDNLHEGFWRWSSGEPVVFTNWQQGEPNNYGGAEDFAAIGWHRAYGESDDARVWNDCKLGGTDLGGLTKGPYYGIAEVAHISFVDPTPGLLVGDSTYSSAQLPEEQIHWFPDALASNDPKVVRPVKGAACDGASRMVLRWETFSPGSVEFRLLDEFGGVSGVGKLGLIGESPSATTVTTTVQKLADGRYFAFASYLPPINFVREGQDDWNAVSRPVVISASLTPNGGDPLPAVKDRIELVRPPVMLLHGLWSSAGTWTWGLPNDGRWIVHAENYAASAAEEFSYNINAHNNVPRRGAQRAIEQLRARGYVATQADVIGHSMGGILSRLHAANRAGDYYRTGNLGQGDFHKLITLYSPHAGSGVPCFVERAISWPGVIGEQMRNIIVLGGGCPDCGAIHDLRPDSVAIQTLPATSVPTRVLVGVGGAEAVALGIPALQKIEQSLATMFGLFGRGPEAIMGSSLHDVVVPDFSAKGGLSDEFTTTFEYVDSTSKGIHTTGTSEGSVAEVAKALLNSPIGTDWPPGNGWESGFDANTPGSVYVPPICQGRDGDPPFTLAKDGGIEMTTPAPGDFVEAGSELAVTLKSSGQFSPVALYVFSTLGASFDDEAPFSLSIHVPPNAMGQATLLAIGVDAEYRIAFTSEVEVEVVFDASLTGLLVDPDPVILFKSAENTELLVAGTYDDGIERDLSGSERGTVFTSDDPQVATVDVNGLVEAVSVGKTTVTAANGGFVGVVDVDVQSINSCYADMDMSGVIDLFDFLAFVNLFNVADPMADCTHDGAVDLFDFLCFVNAFNAGC